MKSFLHKAGGVLGEKARRLFGGERGGRLRRGSIERRRIKRMACHQVFLCSNGKESCPVTVVDLGFGGFKIRSEQSVGKRGDLLHLLRQTGDVLKKLGGSYSIGLVVRVAWTRRDEDGWETGLYLPDAPGSMRIRWFKELLRELDLDETEVFSKRSTRRHRCRLPAQLTAGFMLPTPGMLLDLSPGGGLFASSQAALLGTAGQLQVQWGAKTLGCQVTVVGVRPAEPRELEHRVLHSLKFEEPMDTAAEAVLCRWLEELALND
jgi:hypothetical protein